MTDFSLKEFEALCQRAARGAYMPWGLAEDAARAVCWLERASLPSVSQFVGLLQQNDGVALSKLAICPLDSRTLTKTEAYACPILTGSYLSDAYQTLDLESGVQIERIAYPCFLLPFLSEISATTRCNMHVSWGTFEATVNAYGVPFLSEKRDVVCQQSDLIQIVQCYANWELRGVPVSRLQVNAGNLSTLTDLAARTYLPETELSQATGAGGGSVDDD